MISNISVALSLTSMWMAAMVFLAYAPNGMRHIGAMITRRRKLKAEEYLTTGIMISFLGAFLTTAYWFIHFLFTALGMDALAAFSYAQGPLSNILVRHIPFITAAFFHLVGAYLIGRKVGIKMARPAVHVAIALTLGVVLYVILAVNL